MSVNAAASSVASGTVSVGALPTGVAATNSTAYVTNSNSNTVSVIDLTAATPAVTTTIPVGSFPSAVALSPDGSQAFVTNYKGSTLSIINTATNTVTNTISVGTDPDGVVETGGAVYVGNLLSGTVSVINPSSGSVTGTITLPGIPKPAPSGLAASANGHTLYFNDARNGRTTAVDLTQAPPAVGGSATVGTYPAYLSLAGTTAYVANGTAGTAPGTVSVLDVSAPTPTLTNTITVGSHPYGIATLPSLNDAFASNSGDGTLSVIDMTSNTVTNTISVGTTPDAVATTPDGSTVLVTNEGDGTVSLLHVNQAPVNTVPGTQNVNANGPSGTNALTFSSAAGNAISTSDPDAGSNPVSVTLSAGRGTLTLSGTSGLTFTNGSSGSGSMTFTGAQSDVDTALNGLKYTPSSNFVGADTLTLSVNDQGNTGIGHPQTTTTTVAVNVNNVAPTAGSPSFTGAFGNTAFGVGTSPAPPSTTTTGSVLQNSSDANGDNLTATPGSIPTAHGGSVTMNGDGTFTYEPPAGYTGNDTFTFQVSDGRTTSSGTATVNVAHMVWYVKNNDTGANDGRSTSPFHTLAQAQSASAAGDFIYVYRGDGTTTGQNSGITLKANQQLIGAADSLVVGGTTLLTGSPAQRPSIGNGAGSGVTLNSGNTVQGLNISASGSGAGISGGSGNSGGTITDNVITGASGASGLSLASTSGTWTVSSLSSTTTGGGGAISLSGNTGTISFTGLTASGATGGGFVATGGGTVNATGTNTVTTSTGTAVDIENTTIGASNATFQSVTAAGGGHGIVLYNTGSSGHLAVTGAGGIAGSGGSISSIAGSDVNLANCASPGSTIPAGVGVYLNGTSAPSLAYMSLPGTFGNFGILGYNVAGVTLDHSTLSGTYGDNGVQYESAVSFCGLTGSANITNDTISNGAYGNLVVNNTSGSLNRLTMTGDTFGLNQSSVNANNSVQLTATNATMDVTVEDSTFQGARAVPFDMAGNPGSVIDLVFGQPGHGNTVHNTYASPVGANQDFNVATEGTLTFDVNSNTFDLPSTTSATQTAEGGVFLNSTSDLAGHNGNASGYIRNNTIGHSGQANTGSQGGDPALTMESTGGGSLTLAATNNQIYQFNGGANGGVELLGGQGNPTAFNVTFTGNTIAQGGSYNTAQASGLGFMLDAGTTSNTTETDSYTLCLNFASNVLNGTAATGYAGGDGRFRQRFNTKVDMPGYTGTSSATNVPAYIQTHNSTGPPVITAASSTTAGGGFFNTAGGAACPTPSF